MRKYITLALVLILVLVATACRSSDDAAFWPASYDMEHDTIRLALQSGNAAPAAPAPGRAVVVDSVMPQAGLNVAALSEMVDSIADTDRHNVTYGRQQRHIIQTANTELETEYFDQTIAELRSLPAASGGFVESEQLFQSGRRTFNITMRIPAAHFQEVVHQVENLATVRTSNQYAQDVTDQFYDASGRLATRRIEEERLLALIAMAENVDELLDLERRLSQTRLQIETYTAQLTNLAGLIAYSTIHVVLHDISEEEPVIVVGPTFGGRIGGAFGDSVDSTVGALQNFVVFLAGNIIPILFWGLVIFAVYKVVKLVRRKMHARAA